MATKTLKKIEHALNIFFTSVMWIVFAIVLFLFFVFLISEVFKTDLLNAFVGTISFIVFLSYLVISRYFEERKLDASLSFRQFIILKKERVKKRISSIIEPITTFLEKTFGIVFISITVIVALGLIIWLFISLWPYLLIGLGIGLGLFVAFLLIRFLL